MIHIDGTISNNDFNYHAPIRPGEEVPNLLESIIDRLPEDLGTRVKRGIQDGRISNDSFTIHLSPTDADLILSHVMGDDEISTVLREEASVILAADENATNLLNAVANELAFQNYQIIARSSNQNAQIVTFSREGRNFYCLYSPDTLHFTLGEGTITTPGGSIMLARDVPQSVLDDLRNLMMGAARNLGVDVIQEPSAPNELSFSVFINRFTM